MDVWIESRKGDLLGPSLIRHGFLPKPKNTVRSQAKYNEKEN
jgi:hypothetical protein